MSKTLIIRTAISGELEVIDFKGDIGAIAQKINHAHENGLPTITVFNRSRIWSKTGKAELEETHIIMLDQLESISLMEKIYTDESLPTTK